MSMSLRTIVAASAAALVFATGCGEKQQMLSITTGGTGGVYYPLGGALANVLTEKMAGFQVTSEVTGGSVDNLKLVGSHQADMGFAMVDAAFDALKGRDRFDGKPMPIRALAVLYPNRMHAVTTQQTGIRNISELAGKRVSVGSPGSATEVMAVRILEAYGIDQSVRRERLSAVESVNALKDGKIQAFFFAAGLPTAAATDLAATPGLTIQLLDHANAVPKLNAKYGPLYAAGIIPKDIYPGMAADANNVDVWNIMFANADMPDELVREVLAIMFDNRGALELVHKDASQIRMENQALKISPIPYHPAAIEFYRERGVTAEHAS
ncbi:MAG TPA: TAXI family TRAP transporter solute-binding subunit [Burkholderiales bacterium]|nr:TAXI family TRAP transporter solute-binding subunit [Burkholderiales bacterium]